MFKLMKNKKGFTLVEVIVVLVILAILAAIMIPSMTGWIDKAKEKSVLVEARSALLAAQTLASEQYATTPDATTVDAAKCKDLGGFTGTASNIVVTKGTVVSMTYTPKSGSAFNYTQAGGWVKAA